MVEPTEEQLALFAEDSLASPTALWANEAAMAITVPSGERCLGLFKNQGPLGSLVRMLLVSKQWASIVFALTWSMRVTPYGYLIFQLRASAHDMNVAGYTSLPTPLARDFKDSEAPVYRDGVQQMDTLGRVLGGTPHPEFVEAMMGFPIGWTDLEL
jgi:hypothetical protein